MPLTVMWLNAQVNKPQTKIIRKSDGNGLGVRISLQGKITFTFRYRYKNKQSSIDLGTYPLMTIQQARNTCNEYRAQLEQGYDPADYKFERGQRFQTFKDYAESWYNDYFYKKVRASSVMGQIRKHLYPKLGDLVVSKTTTHQWLTLMSEIHRETELSDLAFKLIVARVSQILNYATKHYKLPVNPASGITGKDFDLLIQSRNRYLIESEVVSLIRTLLYGKIYQPYKDLILLMLHTGARVSEISQSQVKEFNFSDKIWTIPAHNSKAGHQFYRPLTDKTIELLKAVIKDKQPEDYLFPNYDFKPVSVTFHRRAQAAFQKWGTSHIPNYRSDWVLHDLRRTFRTNISRWISRFEVAELTLGHVQSGIHATYDLYKYIDEMREGYIHWVEFLGELEAKAKKLGPTIYNM